ncbi:PREDICTED: vomeronasal type-1 receptor 90-like [Chinchilla lanigera]|uniref:vomeronasal type-1 receptor 90-like n=1 Tax=Chinchilla lanigera TaxID=34839 RepID=UPI00038EEC79|nr:PREDICTED: vomeronasal type-1 receptor 90-like [Chinchilla lanigera]
MKKDSILSSITDLQYMFFFEVSIGVMANVALLLFHVLKFLLKHRPRPTDLTIGHLALIHTVMLLTVGFIAMDMFGFQDLGDDITCKSVIYLYRVMRGLSICTTCLLSVLQAITLSPRSSCLAKFKQKSLHQNLCCFFFLWVLNMLTTGRFLISTVATPNVTSHSLMFVTRSCSLLPRNSSLKYISISLWGFQQMCFIGLMALSSGYKVLLLCRHERQSQHLHSTSLSPKASAEQRATRTILLLMSFFIVMYILDSVIASTSEMLWNFDQIRHCVQLLVGNCYAAVSPLVLISTERRVIRFLDPCGGKIVNVCKFSDGKFFWKATMDLN